MTSKIIGSILILGAVVIFGFVTYYNSAQRQQSIVFSRTALLDSLWGDYKMEYLEPNTYRTLDKQRNNITTSEGQSYTLLRAVWRDDQGTFDSAWKWTHDLLQRRDDNLFAWLFGQRADGSYGIITDQGGNNSAADADTDIAVALLFASKRWQNPSYLEEAKKIISSIWEQEVVTVNGAPYLVASNSEKSNPATVIVNPSYFAPYAYRMFAEVDPGHDWNALVDSSYALLARTMTDPLNTSQTVGLPPNWIALNRQTGTVTIPSGGQLNTDYGYDAMRIPWRLALDWQWYQEPRAKTTLEQMSFLKNQWEQTGTLRAVYGHDGKVIGDYESPAMYGGASGYFRVAAPEHNQQFYDQKLRNLYNPDTNSWREQLGYYEDNWAWFGIALEEQALANLWHYE